MQNKFQQEIDRMAMMQPVGGGGGADAQAAAERSRQAMDNVRTGIERSQKEHEKRMA